MKIKLSKTGDASIIQDNKISDDIKDAKVKDKTIDEVQENVRRTESPIGMKIKLSKSGDASIISNESEKLEIEEVPKKIVSTSSLEINEEPVKTSKTMILKLTKTSDTLKKDDEVLKKSNEQPLGMMKIKLSKTGDPSIIHVETPKETKYLKKDHR